MATTISTQDIVDAKRDIDDIGKAVNEKVIVSPRYGADFKSLPMISAEGQSAISTFESNGQSSINSFDATAQSTINDWQDAINTITMNDGVPALAVSDASGQTQQQVNDNISFFNAVSVLSPAEKADIMLASPVLDLTAKAQLAIDTATAQGKVCVFPYGTWNIKCANEEALSVQHVAGLVVPSNAKIGVMPKCTLKMISTWAWAGQLFWISEVQNVHIFGGGTILGDRATHDFTNPTVPANRITHEWVWGIHVVSGIDIVIEDLKIRGWTGDCIHVWSKNKGVNPALESKNITVKGCTLDGARRNNLSITDCDGFFVLNNTVINAGITDANSEGTNPKAGIDLEPFREAGFAGNERVMNGVVSGNFFKNNRIGGVLVFSCYNVAVIGNTSHGDGFNYSYSNNVTISDNVFHFYNRGSNSITTAAIAGIAAPAIDWYAGFNNVAVSGNIILDFPTGIDARGVGINMNNNTIKGASTRAISCFTLSKARIFGNLIYDSVVGVGGVGDVTDVDITANKFLNISNRAINVNGEIAVKGNTFKHCLAELHSSGKITFSENVVDRVGTPYGSNMSVYVFGAGNSLIATNNVFLAVSGDPLSVATGASLKAVSNSIDVITGTVAHNSTGGCIIKGNLFTVNNAATTNPAFAIGISATNGAVISDNTILGSPDGLRQFSQTIATYNATSSLIVNNTVTKAVTKHSSDIERNTTIVGKAYSANVTYDPPSLATGTQQSTTVTLNGASLGDNINVSFDKALSGTRMWGEVASTNTVTVYHRNDTGAAVDVPSGTLTVKLV